MQVGTASCVVAIRRYPVKSMAGETLRTAALGWAGVAGDRQYAFVRRGDRSRFPYLTGRDLPGLVRWRPRYLDPDAPERSEVAVTAPDGTVYAIDDPRLLAALGAAAGGEVSLLRLGRGLFDSAAVSLLDLETAAAVAAAHGGPVGTDRFRANLLLRLPAPAGGDLALGGHGARLHPVRPIPRCAMVAIDPESGAREKPVMRTVAQHFGNLLGTYAETLAPGPVSVGDAVGTAWTLSAPPACAASPAPRAPPG